ncbi:unnamed protein product [Mycena citricolor]|uniref:Uncharacterized protein n=1 Tax=Mycena citricolor TaxID=2018698 RepID=A0AAD2HKD1_9AGAR|nr:unnamed protein product [Mycena citricolor]CAK5276485.1 unnamed protein product [Mycena citricolor]
MAITFCSPQTLTKQTTCMLVRMGNFSNPYRTSLLRNHPKVGLSSTNDDSKCYGMNKKTFKDELERIPFLILKPSRILALEVLQHNMRNICWGGNRLCMLSKSKEAEGTPLESPVVYSSSLPAVNQRLRDGVALAVESGALSNFLGRPQHHTVGFPLDTTLPTLQSPCLPCYAFPEFSIHTVVPMGPRNFDPRKSRTKHGPRSLFPGTS